MKIEQNRWLKSTGWSHTNSQMGDQASLAFVFGDANFFREPYILREARRLYPKAHIFGCSTAGEIFKTEVRDHTVTLTAVAFEKTPVKIASLSLHEVPNALAAGQQLISQLPLEGLKHVLVLSSVGLGMNGTELVQGLVSVLPKDVQVSGGLAAGGQDIDLHTFVIANDQVQSDMVAVVGLYGDAVKVSSASRGGWESFGPEHIVTRMQDNILYELNGRSALKIYKEYLKDAVHELPESALRFPLSVRVKGSEYEVVRAVINVDEERQGLIFSGELPPEARVRFMRANLKELIGGAGQAAMNCLKSLSHDRPQLALLISCVGRKLILKQKIEEEVEEVARILGPQAVLTGFYSYGEIAPFRPDTTSQLHNQTMTITTISEDRD